MSGIYEQLKRLADNYAAREISLDDFRVNFAGLYFLARQSSKDARANSLASKIVGPLSELARHHRDEDSFREALGVAIRLFEDDVVSAVVHLYQENSGSNDNGVSISFPIVSAGNNAGFNRAAA